MASLFRDVYVSWPEQRVSGWVSNAYESVRGVGLLRGVDLVPIQALGRLLWRPAASEDCRNICATPSSRRKVPVSARHPPDSSLSGERSARRYPVLRPISALVEDLDLEARLALAQLWRVEVTMVEEARVESDDSGRRSRNAHASVERPASQSIDESSGTPAHRALHCAPGRRKGYANWS